MPRRILACVLTLAPAGAASAAPVLNLPAANADVKASLARGEQADIVVLGDSLSFDDVYGFRSYFTDRMQTTYGDAGPGFVSFGTERSRFGSGWTAGAVNASDPAPHHGLDGLWLKAPTGTTSSGVVSAFYERMDIHYVAEPGGGAVQLTQEDGAVPIASLDTNSATRQVRTYEYRFPPTAATTIRFTPDGTGPVTLLGMNLVNDQNGVRVHRASNGGWGVDNFLRRDWTFDCELGLLNTDMIMVAIGTNDAEMPGAEFSEKLGRLLDRLEVARPDAEVVLVSPHDFGHANLGTIAGVMEQLARQRGVGFINLFEAAGDNASFRERGYLSPDGVHYTPEGARYVGNLLAEAFRTDGASMTLVPEPGAAVLCFAGALALLRRRR